MNYLSDKGEKAENGELVEFAGDGEKCSGNYKIGNTCPRGKMYAEKECVNPERIITTTMRTDIGTVIPVKTDKPVPKSKMFEVMELINGKKAHLPINIGDILIENVFGSNVVSVKNESK